MGRIKEPLTLIIVFLLTSLAIWVFTTIYYASRALDLKAQEIAQFVKEKDSLAEAARELLRSRPEILYLGIIDSNGIVKQSFGDKSLQNMKKFTIPASGGQSIVLGLEDVSFRDSATTTLLFWCLLIAFVFALIFFALQHLYSIKEGAYLEKIATALKSVAHGDYTVKLDIDGKVSGNRSMLKLFESFNLMVDHIARRQGGTRVHPSKFQPQVIRSSQRKDHAMKRVVTFVNRIAGAEDANSGLTQEQYDEFLNKYRKQATSIVLRYGGTIEAIFQGEIVAFFNAPKDVQSTELRAIFSGVETLQTLALMNKESSIESANAIGGRIGIDCQTVPFNPETGLPANVKEVLTHARRISNSASNWRVVISQEVFKAVKEHIEAKELSFEGQTVYSVLSVEETAINA